MVSYRPLSRTLLNFVLLNCLSSSSFPTSLPLLLRQFSNNMLYPKEDKENKVLLYAVSLDQLKSLQMAKLEIFFLF